jgi:hypothetical protein
VLLDWQHNGAPGSGGTEVDEVWRFFGDFLGTRSVNGLDNGQFLTADGSTSTTSGASDSVVSATTNSQGLVTITLTNPVVFVVGETVTISGVAIGGNTNNPYNGTFTVLSVSGNSFTYQANSTPSATADANTGGASAPTYQWFMDFNMDGNLDVGNTTDHAAFRQRFGHRLQA